MDVQQAREYVVLAGKKLLESGLIARTWGNVSCRINDRQFVITPSGRAYETLRPEEIVTVNIEDGCYSGDIKPSSEKDLHAEIYKHRKDANFIIHTHQKSASALSSFRVDIPVLDLKSAAFLGNRVACAAYGLPGSKKLKKEAVAAFDRSGGKAILLANHGAVCLGKDMEEAFQVAFDLEKFCADYTCQCYFDLNGGETSQEAIDDNALRDCYVRKWALKSAGNKAIPLKNLFNSERTGDRFVLYCSASADEPFPDAGILFKNISINKLEQRNKGVNLPLEAELHREIYRLYKNIGAVIHTTEPDILAVSRTGRNVVPLLDDFAQIIGTSARMAEYDGTSKSVPKVAARLKGNSAVLVKGNGALCCGPNKYDAFAAVMVLAKNCKAMISAALLGGAKPINPLESMLMRYIYLKKYSKKI
jgi:L-ribulose-5-phosphate 4-epimerase